MQTRDTSERRQRICALLRDRGSVQVAALAESFEVSSQTIRKDLGFLARRGVATRSYGGAMRIESTGGSTESGVDAKREVHRAEKERIGRHAAALVQPSQTVILDSGTTTLQIARFLPERQDVTVITNDLAIITALAAKSGVNAVLLGGTLRRKSMAFYGAQTELAIHDLLADVLFLGADGVDAEHGVTTHYEPEASLNRCMVKVARRVIAVADSSKFGRVCPHRIAQLERLDGLITDDGARDYFTQHAATPSLVMHYAA